MPEEEDMRFFYTILVSGLLLFQEVPIDQHSPATVDDVPYGAKSTLLSELGLPSFRFPTQYKPNFSAQLKIESEPMRAGVSQSRQEDAVLTADEAKATPTPLTKVTTVDTALATYGQQSALPITGFAMYYNPNVMQEVLNNRMAMGHISACPECIGNVALLRAGDLNRRVWLEWADGTVDGPYLVADTAARHHVAQLLARRWVVDVDNRTAVRRAMAGPVMVTVWGAPPHGEAGEPPFMPLYSTMPTAAPTSVAATLPTPLSTALPTQAPMVATLATPLPTPLPTSLPTSMATPYTELVVKPVVGTGFPADTPVPTLTPLPVISTTATPPATVTPIPLATVVPTATFVPAPTLAPTAIPSSTPLSTTAPTTSPTASPVPTFTPTLAPAGGVTTTVTMQGFPPDTPIPTITPLPFITSTPTPLPN